MPPGRPTSRTKGTKTFIASGDQKDFDYMEDHRGTTPRGEYLFACMYESRNDHEKINATYNELKETHKKIAELEKENLFLKSTVARFSKKAPMVCAGVDSDPSKVLTQWWNDHEIKIKDAFNRRFEPAWEGLFTTAILEYSGIPWNSSKDVKAFVMEKIKNNGGIV